MMPLAFNESQKIGKDSASGYMQGQILLYKKVEGITPITLFLLDDGVQNNYTVPDNEWWVVAWTYGATSGLGEVINIYNDTQSLVYRDDLNTKRSPVYDAYFFFAPKTVLRAETITMGVGDYTTMNGWMINTDIWRQ